jgi:hypothetical protein
LVPADDLVVELVPLSVAARVDEGRIAAFVVVAGVNLKILIFVVLFRTFDLT